MFFFSLLAFYNLFFLKVSSEKKCAVNGYQMMSETFYVLFFMELNIKIILFLKKL